MSALFTLTLEAPDQGMINLKLVAYLRDQGYHVADPNDTWETITQFLRRNGLRKYESFHRALRAYEGRGNKIYRRVGKTGRIIELLSNPAFDAFCRRNKPRHSSLVTDHSQ